MAWAGTEARPLPGLGGTSPSVNGFERGLRAAAEAGVPDAGGTGGDEGGGQDGREGFAPAAFALLLGEQGAALLPCQAGRGYLLVVGFSCAGGLYRRRGGVI